MSVVLASPTAKGSEVPDPVRDVQDEPYWAAKADPGRRYDALPDKGLPPPVSTVPPRWPAWLYHVSAALISGRRLVLYAPVRCPPSQ